MTVHSSPAIITGDWEIDLTAETLWHREEERFEALTEKDWVLLRALATRIGTEVSKAELAHALGLSNSPEHVLNGFLGKLYGKLGTPPDNRKGLGKMRKAPRAYIESTGSGYRLLKI